MRTDALDKLTQELNTRMQEQADLFAEKSARLQKRESELQVNLESERSTTDRLREDIANAEIVTVTQRVEVPADCPAVPQCAEVDSLQYRTLYNRAATGALSDTRAGDGTLP